MNNRRQSPAAFTVSQIELHDILRNEGSDVNHGSGANMPACLLTLPPMPFANETDRDSVLVIPVKTLPNELWVGTMFAPYRRDFDRRNYANNGVLFQKETLSVGQDGEPWIYPLAK